MTSNRTASPRRSPLAAALRRYALRVGLLIVGFAVVAAIGDSDTDHSPASIAVATPATSSASSSWSTDPQLPRPVTSTATCGGDRDCELVHGYRMDGTRIQEDEPEWDCRYHGNSTCGPDNGEGVPAGAYDAGTLVAPWPAGTSGPQRGATSCSGGKVLAEDGTCVRAGFYDRTDYNRNGVVDQDEGFARNPRPADVIAGSH